MESYDTEDIIVKVPEPMFLSWLYHFNEDPVPVFGPMWLNCIFVSDCNNGDQSFHLSKAFIQVKIR